MKYILTDGQGSKSALPKPAAPKKGKKKDAEPVAAINLDDFLGVGVTVTGQGTMTEKNGKKVVSLNKITGVQKGGSVTEVDVFPKDGE